MDDVIETSKLPELREDLLDSVDPDCGELSNLKIPYLT